MKEKKIRTLPTILEGKLSLGFLNGFFSFSDESGEKYSGTCVNGLPHGKGLNKRTNGEFQNGEFKDGIFVEGFCCWTNGQVKHEGEFKEGKLINGVETRFENGKLSRESYYSNGLIYRKTERIQIGDMTYVGDLVHEQAHGSGKLYDIEGTLIGKGIFENNKLVSGYLMKGKPSELKLGKLTGFGKGCKKEKTIIGQFVEGELSGLGAEVGTGHELKIGQFENGHLVQGLHLKDIVLRDGKFNNGMLNGEGFVRYFAGKKDKSKIYTNFVEELNSWKHQCLSGKSLADVSSAIKSFQYSDYESGIFKNGVLDGKGESTLNGCIRKGMFVDGKLEGEGEKIWPDKTVEKGMFFRDELEKRVYRNCQTKGVFLANRLSPSLQQETVPKSQDLTIEMDKLFENCFEEGDFDENGLAFGDRVFEQTPKGQIQYEFKYGSFTGNLTISNQHYSLVAKIADGEIKAFVSLKDKLNQKVPAVMEGSQKSDDIRVDKKGRILEGNSIDSYSGKLSSTVCTDIYGIRSEFFLLDYNYLGCRITFLDLVLIFDFSNYKFLSARKNGKVIPPFQDNYDGKGIFIIKNKIVSGKFVKGVLNGKGIEITCVDKNRIDFCKGKFTNGILVEGLKKSGNICYRGRFVDSQIVGRSVILNENFSYLIGETVTNRHFVGKVCSGLLVQEGIFYDDLLSEKGIVVTPEFRLFGEFRKGYLTKAIEITGRFASEIILGNLNPSANRFPVIIWVDTEIANSYVKSSDFSKPKKIAVWNFWGIMEIIDKEENQKVNDRYQNLCPPRYWNGALFETEKNIGNEKIRFVRTWFDRICESGPFVDGILQN